LPAEQVGPRAWQSSTYREDVAERAVDGNTDTNYGGQSCSHTLEDDKAWLAVDLGLEAASQEVTAVTIFNRGDWGPGPWGGLL
jgi:thiol-activated cytolysin